MAPYSVAINLARHQRRRGHSARPWGIRFLREWAAFCCSAIACSRPARHGAAPLLCAALALLLRQDSVLLRILGGAPVASMQLGAWWRQDERRKQRTALLWARCRGGLRCPAVSEAWFSSFVGVVFMFLWCVGLLNLPILPPLPPKHRGMPCCPSAKYGGASVWG